MRSGAVPCSIGFTYSSVNRRADGNRPGAVSEHSDHRSMSEFSSGVPVIASRNGAGMSFAALCAFEARFFTNWASSRMSPPHSCAR